MAFDDFEVAGRDLRALLLLGATLRSGDLIVVERVGNVRVDGAMVGDVLISKTRGAVSLSDVTSESDTTVSDVSGAVMIVRSTLGGDVEIKSNDPVNFVVSSVRLEDVDMLGDVVISKAQGPVTLRSVTGEDVAISNTQGPVTLESVIFDSDTKVSDNGGAVMIAGATLLGDLEIKSNDDVSLVLSSVKLEDVIIAGNSRVTIDGVWDFNLTAVENDAVTLTGSTFTDANIAKNGTVWIGGNDGEALVCHDNVSVTNGGGNTVGFTDGQCVGF